MSYGLRSKKIKYILPFILSFVLFAFCTQVFAKPIFTITANSVPNVSVPTGGIATIAFTVKNTSGQDIHGVHYDFNYHYPNRNAGIIINPLTTCDVTHPQANNDMAAGAECSLVLQLTTTQAKTVELQPRVCGDSHGYHCSVPTKENRVNITATDRKPMAYIANSDESNDLDSSISVIDLALDTKTVDITDSAFLGLSGTAVSPDGSRVYAIGGNELYVIDTATNTLEKSMTLDEKLYAVAVSTDGKHLYIVSNTAIDSLPSKGFVYIINTDDYLFKKLSVNLYLNSHIRPAVAEAVSPDGKKLYFVEKIRFSGDLYVSVLDLQTDDLDFLAEDIAAPGGAGAGFQSAFAITPDGKRLFIAVSRINNTQPEGKVVIVDTSNGDVIDTVNVGLYPFGVAISPDGTRVYVTNRNNASNTLNKGNTVSVINTLTDSIVTTITIPGIEGPAGIAVSPDGTKVYTANYGTNNVSVIDTATNTVLGDPIEAGSEPISLGKFIG